MANLFDGGNIDAFLADPMTRLAISLLSQPNRGPQGQRIGFGQQLGGALGAYQGMQAQDAQMALAKLRRQQAERAEKMEQEQMARQEAFRGRASEYVKEGQFDPRAALTIGVETGALDPMQAIQQAKGMKRYVPVGGNMLFDTETGEYVQAPPQPVKLGQGQMYATPDEQGGYTPQLVNPRTFAPPRPTGQAGGGLGKPPSGYRWSADGNLEPIPGGPAASRAAADTLKRPLPASTIKDLSDADEAIAQMKQLRDEFKTDYGGYVSETAGRAANEIGARAGGKYGPQATWWQLSERFNNIERHPIFGASLTANELKAWNRTTVHPGMEPEQIKANLKERAAIMDRALDRLKGNYEAGGYRVPGAAERDVSKTPKRLRFDAQGNLIQE